MSITNLRLWAQTQRRCSSHFPHFRANIIILEHKRKYATHQSIDFGDSKSQLLNDSSDKRQCSELKHDTVGPFQLGLSPSALRKGEKIPKWSELSTGGKVIRTTARTTNLGVILLGAGLSALLIYSLTSELFSKNSPTVLYGDACERIKQSTKISKYLNGPLTFHNNPPSSVRPRHRNRHVTSRVMVDSYGQEHMIMTFYVQGRPESEMVTPSESSYLESSSKWLQDKGDTLSELSYDEVVEWSKDTAKNLWDRSVRAFKYLSGTPLPPPILPEITTTDTQESKTEDNVAWSFAGMFSSLKGPKSSGAGLMTRQLRRHFTEGEVHADLVKDQNGYFVFRYLLVDIPGSRDPNPVRVFVEREPGVRESEPVMRWIS